MNVGFGVLRRDYEKHAGSLRTWFDALLHSTPLSEQFRGAELSGEVASWPLPLAEGPETLHGDGIVLVGDAAGLVDPFWGHGIDSAMVSGKLAAGAIVAALGGGATRERALQDYTDAVSARFAATWQVHLLLREQVATFHSLLASRPSRSCGCCSACIRPQSSSRSSDSARPGAGAHQSASERLLRVGDMGDVYRAIARASSARSPSRFPRGRPRRP